MLALLSISVSTFASNVLSVEADRERPLLLLEIDKDEYLLGELVNFTLTNIGNETVVFGGFPFCEVYTWPSWEPVAPQVFIYLAWSLDPGQSSSWTWDQFNGYVRSPAEAGLYVAKDVYGYDYTVFFKIRATIVPISGDVNGDGIVDISDIVLVAAAYSSITNDPNWNPFVDMIKDNVIDIYDLIVVAAHYGEAV